MDFLLIFVFMCVIAHGFYVFLVIAVLRICDYNLLLRIYIYVIYLCYQLIVIPTTLSCESHMRGSVSAEPRDPFVRESFVSCDPSHSPCQCQSLQDNTQYTSNAIKGRFCSKRTENDGMKYSALFSHGALEVLISQIDVIPFSRFSDFFQCIT